MALASRRSVDMIDVIVLFSSIDEGDMGGLGGIPWTSILSVFICVVSAAMERMIDCIVASARTPEDSMDGVSFVLEDGDEDEWASGVKVCRGKRACL